MDELKENFILEATELLDDAEEALLDFDSTNDFQNCYNKVFRAMHSLKGAAGMFGIDVLQEHLHKLETQLTDFKSGFPEGAVDYFLVGVDASRSFFETDTISFEYRDNFDSSVSVKSADKVERKGEIKKRSKLGKVFVVDDEPLILEIISELLSDVDADIELFNDGEEVLKKINHESPDLIISDIKMPKVDGLTMSKELVERDLNIPIIFVSGYVTKDAVLTGLRYGSHFFIEKPFDENNLLSLVVSILKNIRGQKLLDHSLDYIMYQFANQEEFLIQNGREKEVELIRKEIKNLIDLKNELFF